jgi:hypothetical protein
MTPQNPAKENTLISHFDIARLACLHWQNDGCPQGRDLDYWLKAERQLKTDGLMLVDKSQPQANKKTNPQKSNRMAR